MAEEMCGLIVLLQLVRHKDRCISFIKPERIAPPGLRRIHCLICSLQQTLDVDAVGRENGNSDRSANLNEMAIQVERF